LLPAPVAGEATLCAPPVQTPQSFTPSRWTKLWAMRRVLCLMMVLCSSLVHPTLAKLVGSLEADRRAPMSRSPQWASSPPTLPSFSLPCVRLVRTWAVHLRSLGAAFDHQVPCLPSQMLLRCRQCSWCGITPLHRRGTRPRTHQCCSGERRTQLVSWATFPVLLVQGMPMVACARLLEMTRLHPLSLDLAARSLLLPASGLGHVPCWLLCSSFWTTADHHGLDDERVADVASLPCAWIIPIPSSHFTEHHVLWRNHFTCTWIEHPIGLTPFLVTTGTPMCSLWGGLHTISSMHSAAWQIGCSTSRSNKYKRFCDLHLGKLLLVAVNRENTLDEDLAPMLVFV
jgi:hypothetical protein